MLKRMKARYNEIKILHILHGIYLWSPWDVWYVLTGKI